MSRKHPRTRYVIVRNVAQFPAVADTFTVVSYPSNENLSHHESNGEAAAAVKRYKAGDARRRRQAKANEDAMNDFNYVGSKHHY